MVGERKRRNLNHVTAASQMKTAGRNADAQTPFSSKRVLAAMQIHFLFYERASFR